MSNKPVSHTKIIAILLGVLVLLTATAVHTITSHNKSAPGQNVKIDGLYLTTPKVLDAFQLTDTSQSPYTEKSLQGHWTMMFFGFTNCGMVCPLTMTALKQMYASLEKDLPPEQLPDIVMVTVDPERDSVDRMKEYVTAFNPKFRGARAEEPQLTALEKQLHLAAVKISSGDKNAKSYTVNHSAEIMVFNPEGKLQAFFAYPHQADRMEADYRTILRNATTG